MRVGILTINDYANYGNRLQNYAVQEVLKNVGADPITIVNTTKINKTKSNGNNSKFKSILNYIYNRDFHELKKMYYIKTKKNLIKKAYVEKRSNFLIFTNKFIKETDFSINSENIPPKLDDDFNYFISGSDQVWNPNFSHFSNIDFLTFAKKEKRIAYSPSFGISSIPEHYKEDFRNWLNGMSYLSVREEAGAKIIEKISNRKATVLIDPTMMLDKDKWLHMARKDKCKPEVPYLCTYFLGDTLEVHKKDIYKIAEIRGLTVVNLGSIYDLSRYSIGPAEFIDYIFSSDIFLTDSFHGTIFSIIFEKPFIVFNRVGKQPSMNSRIDTLLAKFNLMDRKWEEVSKSNVYFDMCYSNINETIEEERQKTYKYLKNALNIEDEC